jgi:hypothetical protein
MNRWAVTTALCLACVAGFAQVDTEPRRTLTLQTSFPIIDGEERLGGFGLFRFNEPHFPWTNTVLRLLYAGVYLDAELSWLLPGNPRTAVGAGAGGGAYIDSITPYVKGERLSKQEFYGDNLNARIFINHELGRIPVAGWGTLPVNLRGSYSVSGSFYRPAPDTSGFTRPEDFLTQTLRAEFRIGGIRPGLAKRQGAELYVAAEANYRTGFEAFGPTGSEFAAHSSYQRLFGSLAGNWPAGDTTVSFRIAGGLGEDIDELSAWKLGGNLTGAEPYAYTLHGYYTREIFAEDFGLANLAVSRRLTAWRELSLHLYGDYAAARTVPPQDGEWHSFFGVGAGIGFRAAWQIDVLLSYGYGINAVRNGERGGHQIGLALEKQF